MTHGPQSGVGPPPERDGEAWSTLLAHVPGMLYRGRIDGARTLGFVSAGCRALSGRAPEEFTGGAIAWNDLIHDEDRPRVVAAVTAALEAGQSFDLRYRLVMADGGLKRVRDHGGGMRSAAGELIGVEGCVSDLGDAAAGEPTGAAAEEIFAQAFRSSPDSIAWLDRATGRIVEVNDGFERLFGWTRAEVLGRTSLDLGLWSEVADRDRFYAELAGRRQVRDFPTTVQRRDGERREVVISVEVVEIAAREQLLIVAHDVTDRVRAERALIDSERRFATAFQSSPFALSISDLATGRYLEVNRGFERIFGWTQAEALGRTSFDLGLWCDAADRARLLAAMDEGGAAREVEVPFRHRHGATIEGVCNCQVIVLDGRKCLLASVEDVTERRRAERQLRKSEEKFAKAFHGSMQSLIISELAPGRFIEVNAGFERIFGYPRAEAIGRTAVELGLWPDPAVRDEVVALLRKHGSMRARELRFIAKGGRPITVLLGLETIEIDGTPCVLAAGIDVTAERAAAEEQARLEQQLRRAQKLDALGQLAGGVAHDFNNILTGIMGNTELALLDLDSRSPLRPYLDEVQRAGARARDLVRRILTFSRSQSPERAPVQVGAVVREVLRLLRSSLPSTIEIVEHFDPAAPTVLADPTQLHQVVMNLGINAAHAIGGAPGRLTIELGNLCVDESGQGGSVRLEPGRYARLAVSDTGCGMDEATLSHIFEPFFTTKAPGEGTGLGLAVVHGIVEAHDGVIAVTSGVGKGTVFEVFLPEHAEPATQVIPAETMPLRGHGEHILVVDDEAVVGRVERALLERLGYRVTLHTDPRLAWDAFDGGRFDLVLSDITMPHLTGVELARRMLMVRPDQAVLLASGHGGTSTVESVRAFGVRGLLAKPLTLAKLAQAVYEALQVAVPIAGQPEPDRIS